MTQIYRSKKLGLNYRVTDTGIHFEDQVDYTTAEIEVIKESGADIKIIHEAKRLFEGEIVSPEDVAALEEKYNEAGKPLAQAADMAAKLIKEGLDGRTATMQAAQQYYIAQSAVGRELGRRRSK